jgi:dTDP-glucose 4,6-dehydratase
MRVLVTGGSGFIGSNLIRLLRAVRPGWHVTNLDLMTYAAHPQALADLHDDPQYRFVRGDIADSALVADVVAGVDGILHLAAESHVDRSILDSAPFIRTNVEGTRVLLEAARRRQLRFLHVSTDEVYGSLGPTGLFTEASPLQPNSPYAAAKASSDLLVRAYHETFGIEAVITRCSNNYGPYQFPEKVIPLFITRLMAGGKVPLYGDGMNIRDWLHVQDHARALLLAFEQGRPGEAYNIGARNELTNVALTAELLRLMGKDDGSIERVADRLGHDRRYAIDPGKLESELGWAPLVPFADGLAQTVTWYKQNEDWWRPLLPQAALTGEAG